MLTQESEVYVGSLSPYTGEWRWSPGNGIDVPGEWQPVSRYEEPWWFREQVDSEEALHEDAIHADFSSAEAVLPIVARVLGHSEQLCHSERRARWTREASGGGCVSRIIPNEQAK